jgi:TonB-linked SusC/RagA family outer membrane protein
MDSTAYRKIGRIMRITTVLVTLACIHVSARGLSQNITLQEKNAPLQKVLADIEKQAGISFIYGQDLVARGREVTLDIRNQPLEKVLELLFKDQPLDYKLSDKYVVLSARAAPVNRSEKTPPPVPPPGDIHGKITDSAGNPLEGVNISVKGAGKGTVTGKNGEFSLKGIDNNVTLIISNVGFESQEIRLAGRREIRIALKQSTSQLDETVVNGYYNTTERFNTGDVTSVKGETINQQPVSDPILALEGRVPGLYIQQTSGVPGAYSTIQVMGQNSIASGNDPLYIVDGVPFSSVSLTNPIVGGGPLGEPKNTMISNSNGLGMSPFNSLNPADIESITVLKDADATAIYGSRGANGVILITTKKGKAGKTKFDLNAYSGGGKVTRMMDLLNTQQYMAMMHEAYANDGLPFPSITTNPGDNNYAIDGFWDTTRYTNWQKVLIGGVADFTNLEGNLSGGNANTQFVIGGGYSKQGTVYPGNSYDQKASANVNLNHTSENQRFHALFTANYTNDNNKLPIGDLTSEITELPLPPDAPALYGKNGNLNWATYNGSYTFNNPIAYTLASTSAITDNLISNLNLGYRFFDALWLKCSFGYTHSQMNQTYLNPDVSEPPPYNTVAGDRQNEQATTDFKTWIIEPQLDYKRQIARGQFTILAGSTFQQRDQSTISWLYSGFSSDALITNPAAASTFYFLGDNYTLYRYDAIYGRIGYDWQEKYLLNLTARRDGSSRFGPGKQFGNFGAVGTGWIFSKENFVEHSLPWLSFGKLRASYGITGNDQITDYQYLSSYTPSSTTYENQVTLSPTRLPNPFFGWESVKKLEGGIELGFLKDRILTTANFYRNRSGNQLVGYPLAQTAGFGSVQYNLPAIVQNSGVEVTLNTINIKTKDFVWNTTFNLTVPSNKLVAYPGIATSSYANTFVVGKSIFIRKLYQSTGVDPQTGLYSFATKNANGLPSYPQDLIATKPVTQKFYGGLGNSLSYKGFKLDVFIQFVNQIEYNYQAYFLSPGQNMSPEPTAVLSRWQKAGQLTNIQRFGTTSVTANNYSYYQGSNAVLTTGSFIRIKNLSLSYQLPSEWRSAAHLQNARVYLQCQNLWTFTRYFGFDPETGGVKLPPLRMITGGVQIGL